MPLTARAVTAAANSIDRELGEDPVRIGTADSEGLFRVVRPPLLVLFEVREPDRIVEISYVRRIFELNRAGWFTIQFRPEPHLRWILIHGA